MRWALRPSRHGRRPALPPGRRRALEPGGAARRLKGKRFAREGPPRTVVSSRCGLPNSLAVVVADGPGAAGLGHGRCSAWLPSLWAGEVRRTPVMKDGHPLDGRQNLIQGHGRDDGVGRRAVAQAAMLVTSSVASPITRVRRIRGRRVGWWCAGVGVDKAGVGLRPAWWYLAKNIAQGAGAIRILCAQCVVRGAGIVVRALVTA
jgi:hypothetical protein